MKIIEGNKIFHVGLKCHHLEANKQHILVFFNQSRRSSTLSAESNRFYVADLSGYTI
jgi:hypothetical protein